MRGPAAAVLAGLLASCSPPSANLPAYGPAKIAATPLALNPKDPSQARVGQLVYAGGVQLAAPDAPRFKGLSGIDVATDGQAFIAVTDFGDLIRGRLVLDTDGRLTGVAGVTIEPLIDEGGKPFGRKRKADAEDVSFTDLRPGPAAGFAVSFEQNHRVLSYAKPGAPARMLFKPVRMRLPNNGGIEGLAARCNAQKARSLWVGFERGEISNRASLPASTRGVRNPRQPRGYQLSGLTNQSCGELFVLYRAYDPVRGFRAVIGRIDAKGGLARLGGLSSPLTRGNMEGLAAVERATPAGPVWRFYLVSDDGFDPQGRRTLLMAFDWVGPAK